jgi:ribulose-5-phosphate 4-epimerase/fuculose-1-phosphate aldolase
MKYDAGIELVVNESKGFHSRLIKVYGLLAQRLDKNSYLMTQENILLSNVHKEDVNQYDINTGEIGKLLCAREDLDAVVFACTPDSVTVSSKGKAVKPALDDTAQLIGEDIPVIDEINSALILKAVENRGGCLINGAGILGVGRNLTEAVAAVQIIEKACEAEVLAPKIGGVHYLPHETAAALRKEFLESYSLANSDSHVNYIGFDEEEFNLRNKLIEYGKKMCKDDLVYGCWGNLSLRLNEKEMLITPSGMDYFKIKIEDIVKMNIVDLSYDHEGRKPSTENIMHSFVYRTFPDCNAIIHTHSNGCSIFASSKAGFAIEDPELKSIMGDVLVAPYAPSGTKTLAVNAAKTLVNTHATILANHGAVFHAPSLDLCLTIANAVEAKACNLLGYNQSSSVEEDVDQGEA